MIQLDFMQKVAAALGDEWTAEIRGGCFYLCRDRAERIILRSDGYDWQQSKRVSVHGIYPRFGSQSVLSWHGDNVDPKITCAISRGPAAVARDMERRFLPGFWHHVERAEELVEQYTNDVARKTQNAFDIGGVLGVDAIGCPDRHRGAYDQIKVNFGSYGDGAMGHVKVNKEDYMFEIRYCPIDLGLQIAQLIAGYGNG